MLTDVPAWTAACLGPPGVQSSYLAVENCCKHFTTDIGHGIERDGRKDAFRGN